MIKYLVLLLLPLSANAQLAYGYKSDKPAFIIHDFAQHDLNNADMFGINRYGFGRGQLELNERPPILVENRSGIFLNDFIGLEIGNGRLTYQNRPAFAYEPAIALGLKSNIGPFSFYLAPRAGLKYGKTENDIINGSILATQLGHFNGSYFINNYYNSSKSLEIIDLTYRGYNMQRQIDNGNELYYIGIKTYF